MEVEYTSCLMQVGQNSLSAKTHRQRDGDPRLTINVGADRVQWVLENLLDGVPEVVAGTPRVNRVDFYFLLDNLRRDRGELPQPMAEPEPALRLTPTNSVGRERAGGLRIRMETPNRRYEVTSVEAFSAQDPSFRATSRGTVYLHLDFENTPPAMYGRSLREAHFGVQANYDITVGYTGVQNQVVIEMPHDTYATIYEDLQNL